MEDKEAKIFALRTSHLTAILNQLHISYDLEHSTLEEGNVCLKVDLALDQEGLLAEKSKTSINLRGHNDFLKKDLTLPLLPHPLLPRFSIPCVPSVSSFCLYSFPFFFVHWPYVFIYL